MSDIVFTKSEYFANLFIGGSSITHDIIGDTNMDIDTAISIMKSLVLVNTHFKDYMSEMYLFNHGLLPLNVESRLGCELSRGDEVSDLDLMYYIGMNIPLKLVFNFYGRPFCAIKKNKDYIMKLVYYIISWVEHEVEHGATRRVKTARREGRDGYLFDGKVTYAIKRGMHIEHLSDNYLAAYEYIDKSELVDWCNILIDTYDIKK